MPRSLVALGSNVGDRRATIARAIELLGERAEISVLAASRPRETPAVGGPPSQPPFLNAAVLLETSLVPEQLHAALHAIERALGRERTERWAARTIDLDLLLYDDAVIDTPSLVVPHPRMAFRRFLLESAAEVAPRMTHPTIGWTIARLLEHLNTALPYLALLGLPGSGKTALARRLVATFGGHLLADPAPSVGEGADDVAGRGYARHLQLLELRARLLDRRAWPMGGQLAVSDFCFDQCLAFADSELADREREAFHRAWSAARAEVVLPKLLVVLDTSRFGQGVAESETSRSLEKELSRLAARPNLFPTLYAGSEPERQFEEAAAAILAMQ
jgi:2-amino-4-hydroxy-6-hydroxymethyldihydropteridine diphosphokinase